MNSNNTICNLLKNKRDNNENKIMKQSNNNLEILDDKGRLSNENRMERGSNLINSISLKFDYDIKRNLHLDEEFPKIKSPNQKKSFFSENKDNIFANCKKSDFQQKNKFNSKIFSKSENDTKPGERFKVIDDFLKSSVSPNNKCSSIENNFTIINNFNNVNNFFCNGDTGTTKNNPKFGKVNQDLKFLKNLAIILEGSDYCVGACRLEGENIIYLASNKMGAYRKDLNNQDSQHILIGNAIRCLSQEIDILDVETYLPIVECLIQNIIYHTFKKKNILYENESEKKNLIIYLNAFFMFKRPKKQLRKWLNLNHILATRGIQNKIKRFVLAFREILKSKLINEIKTREIELEIIYSSRSKVHCEMKLLDYFFKRNDFVLQEDFLEVKKKKTLFIASSRKCCSKCVKIIQKANSFSLNYIIKFPETDILKYRYEFKLPDFMRGENQNVNHLLFKDVLNITSEESNVNFKDENKNCYTENLNTDEKPETFSFGEHSFAEKQFKQSVNNFNNSSKFVIKNLNTSLLEISDIDKNLVIYALEELLQLLKSQ